MKISSVTFEITNLCNLECLHCFNSSGPKVTPVEMDIETTSLILQDLKGNNECELDEVWITGGEPLLHTSFCEMLELFFSFGHRSILVSNGSLIGQNFAMLQKVNHCIRRVHVSLEGLRENNDYIRGQGVFQHITEKVIPLLREHEFHTCVTIHLTKRNQHEIETLARLLIDELDCDLKLGVLRPIGRACHNLIEDMLTPAELYDCIKTIYRLKESYSSKRIWHDWDILSEDIKFYIQDFHGRHSCPAGMQNIMAYTPDYDVYPCVQLRFPEFRIGNFKEDKSLNRILQKPSTDEVYRLLQVRNDGCSNCQYFKTSCHGGCPAIPYGINQRASSIDVMDPYCFASLITGIERGAK